MPFKYAAFAKRLPAQGIFADGFECGDCGMHDDEANCFESLDGFEENFAVAFNDVDLCLRCCESRIWWFTIRKWNGIITNPNPEDRRTAKKKCAGSSRRSNLCGPDGSIC